MKNYKYKIEGLDCANCAVELENELNKLQTVNNLTINFIMQKMTFTCKEENIKNTIKEIEKFIRKEEPDVTIEELE